MDWTKFAVLIDFYVFSFCSVEPTEENPNPVATLTEEQVELIKKVIAGTEVLLSFHSHLQEVSVSFIDAIVSVLAASSECSECKTIFILLEKYLTPRIFTCNLLSSASLRKFSEKLTKCLSVVCGDDSECTCECKTNKEVRNLIIRMAGFVSGYDY